MSVSSQQQEKGEKRTIYTCAQFQAPPSHSPHACWMGRVGEDWLEECPHLGSSPLPTPQPNCPVNWAKSTAGEFCIHRKLLRVDFTSRTHLQMGQPYKKNASSSAGAHFPPRLLCHSSARQPRTVSSVPPGPPGHKEGSVDAMLGNETPLKGAVGCQPTCPVTASYNRTLHSPVLIVATSLYHTMAHATRLYIAMYGIIYHNTHCTSCLLEEQLSEMYETWLTNVHAHLYRSFIKALLKLSCQLGLATVSASSKTSLTHQCTLPLLA